MPSNITYSPMKDPYLNALGMDHLDTEEKYERHARALNEEGGRLPSQEFVISRLSVETLYQLAAVLLQRDLKEVDGDVVARLFTSFEGMRRLAEILPKSNVTFQKYHLEGEGLYRVIEELRVKADSVLYDSARWSLDEIQREQRNGGQL